MKQRVTSAGWSDGLSGLGGVAGVSAAGLLIQGLDQQSSSLLSHFAHRLMDGGESSLLCVLIVIETHDQEVFSHGLSCVGEVSEDASGHIVTLGQNEMGTVKGLLQD